eukprot:jgi/Bigna1/46846/estExt_Genewise1.C_70210
MKISWMAAIALAVLTVQNTTVPITMRLARTTDAAAPGEEYCVPVLVLISEVMKLISSSFLLAYETNSGVAAMKEVQNSFVNDLPTTLKLGVPAGLYFIMNTCCQLANSYLPAAVYQVTYQGKSLVVALMSVILLGRRLQVFRWMAIAGLAIGVAMVNVSKAPDNVSKSTEGADSLMILGLGYSFTAAICSGSAGVYFEMMIKKQQPKTASGQPGKQPSLWLRNIQLAFFSILIAIPACIASTSFDANDPLRGFDIKVWALGVNNALGGLIVALVVKHADNIMKCFSNATSTVLATVICIPLFGFEPTPLFVLGAFIVLASVLLYGEAIRLGPTFDTIVCAKEDIAVAIPKEIQLESGDVNGKESEIQMGEISTKEAKD